MTQDIDFLAQLKKDSRHWLITGVAGFIGSHLLEFLLKNNQKVTGIDNFATGTSKNLEEVRTLVGKAFESHFSFIEGDIRNAELCKRCMANVDFVLHQAALGSVPRSIKEPSHVHEVNVVGFLNMLEAARVARVKRFVFASSSSVYGDSEKLPKSESDNGNPLSPYAASKKMNEIWAKSYAEVYDMKLVGLRYFNVFGPRQNPAGEYAAVIPRWFQNCLNKNPCTIFGDGLTTRDFCYVDNVVRANLKAALLNFHCKGDVFNIAGGEEITLLDLYNVISGLIYSEKDIPKPLFTDFRPGDVRHSRADISKAKNSFQYNPTICLRDGLALTAVGFGGGRSNQRHQ